MTNLNVLNGKVGDDANLPVKINEVDFWKQYLQMINLKWNYWMNEKEVQVFSVILSKEPGISYFSSPHNKELMDDISHLSNAELTRVKKRLLALDLITEEVDQKDKRRSIVLPYKSLINLQRFVKDKKKLKFTFAYEVT